MEITMTNFDFVNDDFSNNPDKYFLMVKNLGEDSESIVAQKKGLVIAIKLLGLRFLEFIGKSNEFSETTNLKIIFNKLETNNEAKNQAFVKLGKRIENFNNKQTDESEKITLETRVNSIAIPSISNRDATQPFFNQILNHPENYQSNLWNIRKSKSRAQTLVWESTEDQHLRVYLSLKDIKLEVRNLNRYKDKPVFSFESEKWKQWKSFADIEQALKDAFPKETSPSAQNARVSDQNIETLLLAKIDSLDISSQEVKKGLKDLHKNIVNTEYPSEETRLTILAACSGDARYADRSFSTSTVRNRSAEGPGSHIATFHFLKGLTEYREHLRETGKLTKDFDEKLQVMQEEHMTLYLSTLLRKKIKSSPRNSPQQTAYINAATALLRADIERVMSSPSPHARGAWLSGFSQHFVPLRYEKVIQKDGTVKTNVLRMSLFNLGAGADNTQEQLENDHMFNETRLGSKTADGSIEFSINDIRSKMGSFQNFCTKIVKNAALGGYRDYAEFVNKTSPSAQVPLINIPQNQRNSLETIIVQKTQKMGDCTAKGQWAMLKKGFSRFNLTRDQYRDFKEFMDDFNLENGKPNKSFVAKSRISSRGSLSDQEMYQIAWSKKVNRSPQALLRLQDQKDQLAQDRKWELECVRIPISSASSNSNTTLTLKDLFQGKDRVVIGPPSIGNQPHTTYYLTPNYNRRLELFLDRNTGKVTVKTNEKTVSLEEFENSPLLSKIPQNSFRKDMEKQNYCSNTSEMDDWLSSKPSKGDYRITRSSLDSAWYELVQVVNHSAEIERYLIQTENNEQIRMWPKGTSLHDTEHSIIMTSDELHKTLNTIVPSPPPHRDFTQWLLEESSQTNLFRARKSSNPTTPNRFVIETKPPQVIPAFYAFIEGNDLVMQYHPDSGINNNTVVRFKINELNRCKNLDDLSNQFESKKLQQWLLSDSSQTHLYQARKSSNPTTPNRFVIQEKGTPPRSYLYVQLEEQSVTVSFHPESNIRDYRVFRFLFSHLVYCEDLGDLEAIFRANMYPPQFPT